MNMVSVVHFAFFCGISSVYNYNFFHQFINVLILVYIYQCTKHRLMNSNLSMIQSGLCKIEKSENKKWRGSVGGIVEAPVEKVWAMVSNTSKLPQWMPMVEQCTDLAGEKDHQGYVRLVSGFMFPQDDGDRSWIKEKLVLMDPCSYSYVYRMEGSNVGLDGSVNSLKLMDYNDNSTLVKWSFEIDPLEGASEDSLMDYLGFLYKSCINRIEAALEASSSSIS